MIQKHALYVAASKVANLQFDHVFENFSDRVMSRIVKSTNSCLDLDFSWLILSHFKRTFTGSLNVTASTAICLEKRSNGYDNIFLRFIF